MNSDDTTYSGVNLNDQRFWPVATHFLSTKLVLDVLTSVLTTAVTLRQETFLTGRERFLQKFLLVH